MIFDGQLITGIAALITSISSLVWALRRRSAEEARSREDTKGVRLVRRRSRPTWTSDGQIRRP